MDIFIPFDFHSSIETVLRRAGYHGFRDPQTGYDSFIHRLGRDFYPRFHIYPETTADQRQVLRLHLDQKKPSYPGAHAHNAEYNGPVVEAESRRISGLLKNEVDNARQAPVPEKKNFFSRLFR